MVYTRTTALSRRARPVRQALMYEPVHPGAAGDSYPRAIQRGQVDTSRIVMNIDVAPTLLEAGVVPVARAGCTAAAWSHPGGQAPPWRDAMLYSTTSTPPSIACVRIVAFAHDPSQADSFWEQPEEWELYDLLSDPDEPITWRGQQTSGVVRS